MESKLAHLIFEDLSNWMLNLPWELKSIPFTHLGIPGSHDSMTFSITTHSKLAPDAEKFLQKLKFLGPLLRCIVSRWAKTQQLDVTEQLNAGIRYFDLRVAIKKDSIYPYFVHGLYAGNVTDMLQNVRDFLDTHSGEVVVLHFNHFYAFNQLDHQNFMRLLSDTFHYHMVPYTNNMRQLSLDHLINMKQQVFVVYTSNMVRFGHPLFWPNSSFPSPWPQTVNKRLLIDKLNEGLVGRNTDVAFVSQFILTPTNWFVTKHLFSTLRRTCAKPLKIIQSDWISKQSIGPNGVNIIISDFIDLKDTQFCKEVIGLNIKSASFSHASTTSTLTPLD